jgi:hypothetical protein
MRRTTQLSAAALGITTLVAVILFASSAYAIPAFAGAQGYGANSTGGRSGDVYHVTSLADTNTLGTLRYGISTAPTGGRTIVFDISGMITLTSNLVVNKSKVTIAGQTAPGAGICFKNYPFQISGSNTIVRNIHSRLGIDANQAEDCITITGGDNVIVDHVSTSWSVDELLSIAQGSNTPHVTVQNSFIAEGLYNSIHPKGAHSYGSLIRPGVNALISWYGNLYADNYSRNPRPGYNTTQTVLFDFRNNVIYNWKDQAGYTEDDSNGTTGLLKINYAGNYAIVGPSGTKNYIFNGKSLSATNLQIYQSGNKIDTNKNGTLDGSDTGWSMFTGLDANSKMTSEFAMDPNYPAVYTMTADQALATVLNSGGAFAWNRDTTDANVVAQVRSYGTVGAIYDTVTQAGGYPTYPVVSRDANFDTDGDGMPNAWETAHGLDPSVANNNGDYDADGYTNLEEYLMELAPIAAPTTLAWTGGTGSYEIITNWNIPWQPTLADRTEINSGKATVGYIDQEAGTLYVANTASGSAELAVTAGSLSIANALYLGSATNAAGTATISGGAVRVGGTFATWAASGAVITGGGTVAMGGGGGGGGVLNVSGGSLTATGPIVMAGGSASTAQLYVAKAATVQAGGLTINSGSSRSTQVKMELDANGHSLIGTTGAVSLAGAMDLQSLNNFRPDQGDTFTLITSTGMSGNFSSITTNIQGWLRTDRGVAINLADSNTYRPIFSGAAVGTDYVATFQGARAGDATGDNWINGTDLAAVGASWLQGGTYNWLEGDFNGDGTVNGTDLAALGAGWLWEGAWPGPAPADAPIPEPATLALLAMGGLAMIRGRRS